MGIWKDKERADWRYRFQYKKKNHRGRGFKTKAEARAEREKHRKRVKSQIPETQTGMAFSTASNLYLDYAERAFTVKTYQGKLIAFKEFIASQGDLPLDHITPIALHDYLKTRPTNNNYNKRRKELCALFTWIRQTVKVPIAHPCWDLRKLPHRVAKPTPPSEQEILQLIVVANPKTFERHLILVLVHTLARIDEVLRLQWEDVNLEHRWIRLWTRKTEDGSWESDELHMNQVLHDTLMHIWRNKKHSKWVFLNERTRTRYLRRPKLMKRLCARAFAPNQKVKDYNGPVYGFHTLRRAVATLLQDEEKVGTKTVSGILRHKKVSTTETYLHTIPAAQVEALKRLEGRFDPGAALGGRSDGNQPLKVAPIENDPRGITE